MLFYITKKNPSGDGVVYWSSRSYSWVRHWRQATVCWASYGLVLRRMPLEGGANVCAVRPDHAKKYAIRRIAESYNSSDPLSWSAEWLLDMCGEIAHNRGFSVPDGFHYTPAERPPDYVDNYKSIIAEFSDAQLHYAVSVMYRYYRILIGRADYFRTGFLSGKQ